MDAKNIERVVEEVLKLVAGYEETVVALTPDGPVRLDYWACDLWSADKPLGDAAVGLWLRSALTRYLDEETAAAVTSVSVYKAVEETCKEVGIDGRPELRYEELHFKPAELRLRGVYNGRAVYKLKPFKCDVKVLAVRLYVPTWSICPPGSGGNCRRRVELTEKLRERGVNVEDVVRGIYVPVDASELTDFIRRVL
jgi:hypothetical protein